MIGRNRAPGEILYQSVAVHRLIRAWTASRTGRGADAASLGARACGRLREASVSRVVDRRFLTKNKACPVPPR